jgi:hypothetical protein
MRAQPSKASPQLSGPSPKMHTIASPTMARSMSSPKFMQSLVDSAAKSLGNIYPMTPNRDDAGKMEARNYKLECLFKNQRPATSGLSIVGLTAEDCEQPASQSMNPFRRFSEPGNSPLSGTGGGSGWNSSFRTDTTDDTVVQQDDECRNCMKMVKRAEDGTDVPCGAAGADSSMSGNARCSNCQEGEKMRVDDERSCCS